MTLATPKVVGAVAPISPAPRIVPALVNGQQVYIPCSTWCTTDHVAENERHLEDIAHCGALTDLVLPGGEPAVRLLGHVRLGADLFAPEPEDRRTVVVFDDRSEMFHLSPDEADEFADRLVAFAEQVRALAQVARGL
jgi:hypothetical protein